MTLFLFWLEKKRQKSLSTRKNSKRLRFSYFTSQSYGSLHMYNACHLSVWNVFCDVLISLYKQKWTWHHLITYSDHKISNIYGNSKTFSTTKVLPRPSSLRIYGFIMWNSHIFYNFSRFLALSMHFRLIRIPT